RGGSSAARPSRPAGSAASSPAAARTARGSRSARSSTMPANARRPKGGRRTSEATRAAATRAPTRRARWTEMSAYAYPTTRIGSPIFVDPARYADLDAWHREAARLRRDDPVHRIEGDTFEPFWAVTKHADIFEIERQHDRFWNTKDAVFDPSGGFMEQIRA